MIENYILHLLILICIYIIAAVAQNITVGNLGLLSLGNVAFYGIGAYTSAILTLKGIPFIFPEGVPFILSFIIAGIVAGFSAILMTYLMKNLKGDYYALGTLAFMFVVYSLFLNWTSLTRGPLGILDIPKPKILGFTFNTLHEYFILTLIIALICCGFFYFLMRSPYRLLMESVRDSENSAKILGVKSFAVKFKVMFAVGFFTGIAGALYAHYITFIDPSAFSLAEVILLFTIIIIGGLGSLRGAILGAILILLIPEPLRFVDLPSSIIGPMRQILYSMILLAIIWFRPKGIFGRVEV
jgi:branched-chain amino acid transport system permease protein